MWRCDACGFLNVPIIEQCGKCDSPRSEEHHELVELGGEG